MPGSRLRSSVGGHVRHEARSDAQIVANDEHTVSRRLDIALDCIRPIGDCGLERSPAVVGVQRAAAAMRDDPGPSHSVSSTGARPRTVARATNSTGTFVNVPEVAGYSARRWMRRITASVRSSTGWRNVVSR